VTARETVTASNVIAGPSLSSLVRRRLRAGALVIGKLPLAEGVLKIGEIVMAGRPITDLEDSEGGARLVLTSGIWCRSI
jgi:hypothetical protein